MTTTETTEATPKPKRQRKQPAKPPVLTQEAIGAMDKAERNALAEVEADAVRQAKAAGEPLPETPVLKFMGLSRRLHDDTLTAPESAVRIAAGQYIEVTQDFLDQCGPDAKVGTIAKAMRLAGVPVGYWLNPCLKFLAPERFAGLKISETKVPKNFPLSVRPDSDGVLQVHKDEPEPAAKPRRQRKAKTETAAA